ncbi:tryptophan-rich sensory protein [Streptomyces sp. NRRL S-146]|uniref:tryptophan-rich sensory protein n=1 Tax=Streptomyces sp. NRRL S-146 TaxID=1463884 RepID=UPI0004C8F382|nr:tryptophan-rich sensory protein [Streptomyces sp. NRRL S-146]
MDDATRLAVWDSRAPRSPRVRRRPLLLLLLAVCYAVAALGGVAASNAGNTYRSLDRPAWAPPTWLFGPVWTVLYAAAEAVWDAELAPAMNALGIALHEEAALDLLLEDLG